MRSGFICRIRNSLDSIVQLVNKQDEDADLLVQEYVKTDFDVRVLVLGKILSVMKRPVIKVILEVMYHKVQNQKL